MSRLVHWTRPSSKLHLRSSEQGVAIVEFALILPVLLLFIIGALEIGYRIYAITVVNGAVRDAARMASTGEFTGTQIDNKVREMIQAFRPNANVQIIKKSYSDFTGVGLPEPIKSGTRESGTYCYEDINNNGQWDQDRGSNGLGGAEDVIYYEAKFTYPALISYSQKAFGYPAEITVSQNTIVSNEPFAAAVRTPAATRCV